MPSYLNVYNTTLEPFKTQFRSKGYRFLPRSLTQVPEEFDYALAQYEKHGLVVIKPGDDLAEKEKQGLMNYLGYLMEVRANVYMYIDEKKRNGVTVDKPRRLLEVEQWIDEIKQKYKTDGSFEPIKSFNMDLPDIKNIFEGKMEEVKVEEIVKAKRGRPKSFSEVNILEEIKN